MSDEQREAAMQPALRAAAEKREANRAYYVCTIYNEAVLIDKSISNFVLHCDLGTDHIAAVLKFTYLYFTEMNIY